MISRWRKPNFRPSSNPFSSILVWVQFPELRIEYFNKLTVFGITKLVGIPVKVNFAIDSISTQYTWSILKFL